MQTDETGVTATPHPENDLRVRILLAAIELFATHGYGATSIRAIVEAVGCTKPALYYHFGSKAELFVAVHRAVRDRAREAFDSIPTGPEPVATHLERFVSGLLAGTLADPLPARLLLTATHHPEQGQPSVDIESLHEYNIKQLAKVLRQGQEDGSIRSDIAAEELTEILLGMVHHRALELLRGKVPTPETSRQLIDVFIHGAGS